MKQNIFQTFFALISFYMITLINSNSGGTVDETVFENIKNSIKIKHYDQELAVLKNTTDISYLVYYYSIKSNNSIIGGSFLKKFDYKLDYLAKILLVNCDTVIPRKVSHCSRPLDKLPVIMMMTPPLIKFNIKTKKINPHTEIKFDRDFVSETTMYDFVVDYLPSFSSVLGKNNYDQFVSQPLFNKVILFTDKNETPKIYKGLSSIFYDRILFGIVYANNTELISKYKITKFPTIIALENPFLVGDEPEVNYYKGESFASEIYKFIENYSLRSKNYVERGRDEIMDNMMFQQIKNENYEKFFEPGRADLGYNKSKIVYFHKGDNSSIPKDIIDFANDTNGFFMFGKFDCKHSKSICKNELFVDVDRLPSLIYFPANQPMKKNRELNQNTTILKDYFYTKFKSSIKKVEESNIFEKIFKDRQNGKFPLIYIHKNETNDNLPLHLISSISEYNEKISFYNLNDPTDEMLEALQVKYTKPVTVILFHIKANEESFKGYKLHDYGMSNTYLGIKAFIENLIGDSMFPVQQKEIEEYPYKFIEIEQAATFYRKCIYGQKKCVLAFLNAEYDKKLKRTNLEMKHQLRTIEAIPQNSLLNSNYGHFFWVNATCFVEFADTFKVNRNILPSLVVYDPLQKSFAKFDKNSEFTNENIQDFLTDSLKNTNIYRTVGLTNMMFVDRYCQENFKTMKNIEYEKLERIAKGYEEYDEEEENVFEKPDL